MFVRTWMKEHPITIGPRASILEAWRLMKEHHFRHLPVVEGGKLVGIITDRDIRQALPSPGVTIPVHKLRECLDQRTVGETMTTQVVTIPPEAPVKEAARLLLEHRIGGLPVMSGDELVGIITDADILRAFLQVAEEDIPEEFRGPDGSAWLLKLLSG